MQRRRRALRHAAPTVPVVDDGYLDMPNWGSQEARVLASQEAQKSAFNDIADFISNRIVSDNSLGNATKVALYAAAQERFRHRLDPFTIRKLVDATILQEKCRREDIARYRAASARAKTVVSSGRTA